MRSSSLSRGAALLLASALLACGAPQTPLPAPRHEPRSEPRLLLDTETRQLFISNAPEGYIRSAYLYVHTPRSIASSGDHWPIGLVQIVNRFGSSILAHWYCEPDKAIDIELRTVGLPVSGVGQDHIARVGRCLGHYVPLAGTSWAAHGGAIDLLLDLGEGDGVREGDRYELLGDPVADPFNRVVTGFERLGECIVQPFQVSSLNTVCRVDLYADTSRGFTEERWSRGGFVHRVQPAKEDTKEEETSPALLQEHRALSPPLP